VADAADHLAEGVGEREGDRQQQVDRQPVGEPVGFSKVVAELALRNPPPLVPSCLMASMKPIGPRAMVWVTPFSASWMLTVPAKGLTAPWPTKMIPKTKAIGNKM
jgi:hypothetical protein